MEITFSIIDRINKTYRFRFSYFNKGRSIQGTVRLQKTGNSIQHIFDTNSDSLLSSSEKLKIVENIARNLEFPS